MPANSAKHFAKVGMLFSIFMSATIVSQSLMDLFATVFSGYLLYIAWSLRNSEGSFHLFEKNGLEWVFIPWFIVVALGFAVNPAVSQEEPTNFWLIRLFEFRWIFVFYLLITGLKYAPIEEANVKWFNRVAIACSLYGIGEYLTRLGDKIHPFIRLEGIFNFSMTHAHTYGPYFCLILGLFLWAHQRLNINFKREYVIALVTMGSSVVLTMTRGVWVGLFAAVITMGFMWNPRKGVILSVTAIFAAIALYFTVPTIQKRVNFSLKVFQADATREDTYDTERVALWKANFMMFKNHPLLGVGYGQNRYLLRSYYDQMGLPADQFESHAHNQYLHFLSGTGILGLICYASFLFGVFYLSTKAYHAIPPEQFWRKGLSLGSIGGQICFIVGGITESNFEHSKVRYAMMIIWAIGVSQYQKSLKAKVQ